MNFYKMLLFWLYWSNISRKITNKKNIRFIWRKSSNWDIWLLPRSCKLSLLKHIKFNWMIKRTKAWLVRWQFSFIDSLILRHNLKENKVKRVHFKLNLTSTWNPFNMISNPWRLHYHLRYQVQFPYQQYNSFKDFKNG